MHDQISLTQRMARHVADKTTALPPELDARMRLLLFDYLAIARTGIHKDSAQAGLASIGGGRASAAPGAASRIEGLTRFSSARDAALVNGISAHGLELDDTHEEASSHPGVAVWPATLAVADELGSSVDEVIRAAAIGYDVMCAIGVLLGAAEGYGRGFHPTGVTGILGSAAACALLLGLTADQTANALSVAANMASGSLEFLADGSWTKRLNAGVAASQGIRAAELGRAGFVGPTTAIEGTHGLLVQYGRGVPEDRELALSLGAGAWQTSVKFYPCCRYMHGNIDLLRSVHRELGAIDPSKVARVDVGVIKAGQTLVSVPVEQKLKVLTTVDAQFNMPFGAALALTTGEAALEDFDNAPEVAAEMSQWLPKVHSYTSERLEDSFPKTWKAEISITFNDGSVLQRSEDSFKGAPGDPADWKDVEGKAATLLTPDQASELSRRILALDGGHPLREQLEHPV